MNQNQQKQAISEWVGVERDYPNCLNAIHEAEKKLTPEQHKTFREKLCVLCMGSGGPISATPQQRSEALCRTLWPERFE